MTDVILIAAMSNNAVIGVGKDIPWHSKQDFKFFKETTLGSNMIMGRTTFEAIGKPLPGRTSIVLSRDPSYARDRTDIIRSTSLDDAVNYAKLNNPNDKPVFIIGGAEIYRHAILMNLWDKIYVNVLDLEVPPSESNVYLTIPDALKTNATKRILFDDSVTLNGLPSPCNITYMTIER